MGKSKALELPATPTYQTDPIFQKGYQDLSGFANQLIKGDYSGFGGLQDATSLHPETTQLALQAAQGFLQPQYAQSNLDIQNMAIANNQNTSSTFTDALAKNAFNLNSQYQGIATNAALQDAQSARTNRIGLFGTGLEALSGATGFGLQNQGQENQFNLENYSNLVAKAIQDNKNANRLSGFQQALSFMPAFHDYYQSQGFTNVPGYGVADVASIAGSFMGMGGGGMKSPGFGGGQFGWGGSAPFAGSYASNAPSLSIGNNSQAGALDAFFRPFQNTGR